MNICIFSVVTYWHGAHGGMEVHGKLLSEGLVKKGHEVTVISTRHPEGKEYEEREGVKLYYLKNTTIGSQRKGWGKESLKKFLELDKKGRFDLVYCQQPIVPVRLIKDRKKKIPSVVIMQGHEGVMLLSELRQTLSHKKGFIQLFKHLSSFLYYHFVREEPFLIKCNAIIAASDEVASSIKRWFFVNDKKIYTVYNGVDINLFRPSDTERMEIRNAYNIGGDEKLILFYSFVTKQKGLHLLIKALPEISKKIDRLKLMVVGEGDYFKEAKELVEKLEVDKYVVFAGYIPHQHTPKYINASDLFVLPTIRQEGLPFVLLEVMSCQKPVISSRIGGILSVIDDGVDGILMTPGNIRELAEKTIYLLENKSLSDGIAKNARQKVIEKFSLDKMIEDTIKIFEIAIKKGNSNREK
ncbi:MAG: glycosyltransferase family 4 protein [Thermodesulfobacteriota bacterium]